MKLSAFTIMDLLIAMIISSIIIALGLEGYEDFKGAITGNEQLQEMRNQRSEIRNLLIMDGSYCDSLTLENDVLNIHGIRPIGYKTIDERIIRIAGSDPDTLSIRGHLSFGFLDKTNLVNSVVFTGIDGWEFRYRKEYKSVVLIHTYGNQH